MRIWMALVAVLGSTLPCAAHAADDVVNHGLRSLGLEDAEAAALDETMTNVLRETPGLRLLPSEPASYAECRNDSACHCKAARAERASKVVFGNVGRIDTLHTFELVLLDTQGCEAENAVFAAEPLAEAAAAERLRALMRRLLTPKESVSETASKSERPIESTPAMVTVFTARQIQDLGIARVEELFRYVPGFELVDMNWGSRVLHYGMAGTILLMVDGIPLHDPVFPFQDFGPDFHINIDQLERVEFVRGPGSVLWGANAYLGVVNFITRAPARSKPTVVAQARYGTLDTYHLRASVEQASRFVSYRLGGTVSSSPGPRSRVYDSPFSLGELPGPVFGNSGMTDPRADRYNDLTGRVRLGPVTIFGTWISYKDFFEISPSGSLLGREGPGWWKKSFGLFGVRFDQRLAEGLFLRANLSRFEKVSWESFVYRPANEQGLPQGLRYLQGNPADPSYSHLAEAKLEHTLALGGWHNQVLTGLSVLNERVPESFANETDLGPDPSVLNQDFPAMGLWTVGLFLQDEVELDQRFSLAGGVRYEHRGRFPSVLNKQAALLYRGQRGGAKLVYSEGFRPPSINDLFATVGVQANQDLKPERSRSLALEGELRGLGPLQLGAGASVSQLLDKIAVDPAQPDPELAALTNVEGHFDIFGAFAEARLRSPRWEAFGNYTYKRLFEPGAPDFPITWSPHTASTGAVYRPFEDFRSFLTLAWTAPFDARVEAAPAGEPSGHRIPAALYLAFGLGVRNVWREGLSLEARFENPFGLVHESAYSQRLAPLVERRSGRELLLSLRWTH